jgi:HSP20 family protein
MFRNPAYSDVYALRDTVDRMFNESFSEPFRTLWSRNGSGAVTVQPMPLDVYATDDHVVILAAVPGMQPDNLDLSIHENTVTFSGKIENTTKSEETKGATWYAHELWSGEVRRSVTLPFPVDPDRAEANFELGILKVTLPKAESAKPRKIQITGGARQQAIEANSTKSS